MNPRSIIIFIRTLLAGGAEYQSLLLAKALSDDYRIKIVVYEGQKIDKKYRGYAEKYEIKIVGLHGNPIRKIFACLALFRRERPNAILNMQPFTNVYGGLIAKVARIPCVFGGIRSEHTSLIKAIIVRFLHNHVLAATIVNSYSAQQQLVERGFKSSKFEILINGLENVVINKTTKGDDCRGMRILSVGRFVWQKDYKTAIDAVEKLVKSHPDYDIRFCIIGYGRLENWIRGYVREMGMDGLFDIVINPESLFEYYQWANIYLCTSVIEGTSNAIIEALCHRLPVVATDAGDNDQMVSDGLNGYLCRKGDSKQIAVRLAELVDDSVRRNYGQKSYDIYETNYSYNQFQKRSVSLMSRYIGVRNKE